MTTDKPEPRGRNEGVLQLADDLDRAHAEIALLREEVNHDRAHTGRLTNGRIPGEIVHGARKMKATG
jgi:hypothetical protein